VGSDHHAQVVAFQEGVEVVWAEIHDVVLLLRVPNIVVLEAAFFFSFMWITPKKIKNFLMIL